MSVRRIKIWSSDYAAEYATAKFYCKCQAAFGLGIRVGPGPLIFKTSSLSRFLQVVRYPWPHSDVVPHAARAFS